LSWHRLSRQLTLIPFDPHQRPAKAFETLLPFYSLQAAVSYFGDSAAVEPEGWVQVDGVGRLNERMFVCRVVGRSMEPMLHDGDLAVFKAHPTGTLQGKILLTQYRGPADPETGGTCTIKRYSTTISRNETSGDQEKTVVLSPLNAEYEPKVFTKADIEDLKIIAELVTVLGKPL